MYFKICGLQIDITVILLYYKKLYFQEHIEVGVVQKVFVCVRGGTEYSSGIAENIYLPSWAWPVHEVYFSLIILIIPGGLMIIAYGTIAQKICKCMKERSYLTGEKICPPIEMEE